MKFVCSFVTILLTIAPCFAAERALEDVIDDVNTAVLNVTVRTNGGEQAMGAGFIISADGYAVTNAHVVEDAEDITVTTIYGDDYETNLVGVDKMTDVALIKIKNPNGLEAVHFADSDNVRVGNAVFAIGNPYGLGNSVSTGIISAKERDIEKGPYDNFLQTDATINQGNSGGPLFSMAGEVVGMNTAIFSLQGENMGLGFATPSNMVQWVVERLKTGGEVKRGWLGLSVRSVRAKDENAVIQLAVTKIEENSPALKAGLKVGDIIERLSNISLKNPRLFSAEVAATKPGTKLDAVVRRDGKILPFELEVDQMPKPQQKKVDPEGIFHPQSVEDLDLSAEQLDAALEFTELQIKAYYDENAQDFVIVQMAPDSELSAKGVEIGNRLIAADNKKIYGAEDLKIKLRQGADKGAIELKIKSGNGNIDVVKLKLGKQ